MYRSPSPVLARGGGRWGRARSAGHQASRASPVPAPPSYPPAARPSVRTRTELDEEIFSLSASTRSSLSMGARRLSRLGALVVAMLPAAAVALWW